MNTVRLGSFSYGPNVYHSHKSPELRDTVAQTADRELQIAGHPILITSVDTPFGCRQRGLNLWHQSVVFSQALPVEWSDFAPWLLWAVVMLPGPFCFCRVSSDSRAAPTELC